LIFRHYEQAALEHFAAMASDLRERNSR
jgi:hypothetical protein